MRSSFYSNIYDGIFGIRYRNFKWHNLSDRKFTLCLIAFNFFAGTHNNIGSYSLRPPDPEQLSFNDDLLIRGKQTDTHFR